MAHYTIMITLCCYNQQSRQIGMLENKRSQNTTGVIKQCQGKNFTIYGKSRPFYVCNLNLDLSQNVS